MSGIVCILMARPSDCCPCLIGHNIEYNKFIHTCGMSIMIKKKNTINTMLKMTLS